MYGLAVIASVPVLNICQILLRLHKVWQGRLWQLPSRDALMLFKYWASGYKLQFETKMWDLCIANHAIMSLLFQLKNLNLIYLNTWHSGREQGITSLSLCEILMLWFCFKFDSDFYLTLNFLPMKYDIFALGEARAISDILQSCFT